MKIKYFLILVTILFSIGCKSINKKENVVHIKYDNPKITYEGRIGENDLKTASEIYWSGSSIKVNFEGTALKITLDDQKGTNYFNVLIDSQPAEILKLKKGKHTYSLAENLLYGKHTVTLTKRNEWTYGTTLFYDFELIGDKFLSPDADKSLFIEFYGDSITTGHGNEDDIGNDSPEGNVTNNYNTYAAMTARALDAEYSCIARGGIGVMVSWYNMIMPEMYNRLNPNNADSTWDFTKKQPDIVVINLFQNDSWIVELPENPEFKRRFGNQKPTDDMIIAAYQSFVKKIRGHYGNAYIICLIGNMDVTKESSIWPGYVTTAVKELNDNRIFSCIVPFKNTKGHPNVEEHQIIADRLIGLIETEITSK